MAGAADSTERRDALVERLFMNAIGAFDLFSVYVGERLGLYRIMAVMFIGDERTEDAFTAPASEVERLYYGFSVFHCLPVGMGREGRSRHGHRDPGRNG